MSAPSPYGFDVWLRQDIDPTGRSASGEELVSNAILHRLTTDLLPMIGAPSGYIEYGEDVRRWCGEGLTADQARGKGSLVSEICQRDPRVLTADASVELAVDSDLYDLTSTIEFQLRTGESFRKVVGISAVTVEFLAEVS